MELLLDIQKSLSFTLVLSNFSIPYRKRLAHGTISGFLQAPL
jgi:hypothetical protein